MDMDQTFFTLGKFQVEIYTRYVFLLMCKVNCNAFDHLQKWSIAAGNRGELNTWSIGIFVNQLRVFATAPERGFRIRLQKFA